MICEQEYTYQESRKSCDFTAPSWSRVSMRFSKMCNCLNSKSRVELQNLERWCGKIPCSAEFLIRVYMQMPPPPPNYPVFFAPPPVMSLMSLMGTGNYSQSIEQSLKVYNLLSL